MIIKNIVLENYGLFSGRNEFDLTPNLAKRGPKKKRPIILFGGKNGAGKTTFLGATRLLLYGKQSLEGKASQADYERELIGHLHRNKAAATSAEFARIGLLFDHVLNGEKNEYYVERNWTLKPNGKVLENFKVDKDGSPLDDVSPEHWESFISDIVPARFSQLFFFDGEKIKNIAEDLSSNTAIAEAIQSLLGIDNVLSLKSDLKVYKSRLLKDSGSVDYKQNIEEIESKINTVEQELGDLALDRANLRGTAEETEKAISSLEAELEKKGGGFAAQRGANKQKVEHLKELIESTENNIRSLCDTSLPFAFCPTISHSLVAQLQTEENQQESATAKKSVIALSSNLKDQLALVEATDKKVIENFLDQNIKNYLLKLEPNDSRTALHQLSPRESREMQHSVAQTSASESAKALIEFSKLESLNIDLHKVSKDLEKAPAIDDISITVEQIRIKSQELGAVHSKLKVIEQKVKTLENESAQLERTKEKLEKAATNLAKHEEKLAHLVKLGPALEAYQDKLTKAKIKTLRSEVTECFNRLARKSDFVKGIDIDSKTFAVTLLDEHNRCIPREDLSSGEKQIFAIAMLWGLARTSGRPLPVVIDTPLGRLDSDHRKKLIENYFPNAGHQVILLSTDTEVDQNLYSQLSPHISQSYHLVYDHDKGHTTATHGTYFWDE